MSTKPPHPFAGDIGLVPFHRQNDEIPRYEETGPEAHMEWLSRT